MFAETSEYYDLIYSFKDYAAEAARITAWIEAEHPSATSVLDVACGTGEHARHLSGRFSIDGVDLEPRFVDIARAKVPGGRFEVADMRDFDLRAGYDVVQCLFSSIGYLSSGSDVVAALRCFRRHLRPEGLILVEPWLTPDVFQEGRVNTIMAENETTTICRMNVGSRVGRVSRLDFHYLIGGEGRVEHRTETHDLALWTVEEMTGFFREAGLVVRHDPEGLFGRGLYLARAG